MNGKFERVVGILSLYLRARFIVAINSSLIHSVRPRVIAESTSSIMIMMCTVWLLGWLTRCVYCCVFHPVFVNGQLNVLPTAINTTRIINHQSCLPAHHGAAH